ncbi:MAG TPA: hypothetical protein VFA93_01905 [Patescibacteria group bacterium]|nr:hypothetical protein [Patescibacteria group bacterium]
MNTLSGDLYIQNFAVAGVNFLNGKVLIDKTGDVTVQNKITAQKVEASEFSTNKAAGSSVLPANTASVDVTAPNANSTARILITPTSLTDKVLTVTKKTDGKFTVSVKQTDPVDINFDWFVLNQ